MHSAKPRFIFIALAIYVLAAFAWWAYEHFSSQKKIIQLSRDRLELLCHKATLDVNGAIEQGLCDDTNEVKQFFYSNYAELEILFGENSSKPDQYLIRPSKKAYDAITEYYARKRNQFVGEGIVILIILLWGITWGFRTFERVIQLNKSENNFILSITHELKTPLASIRLNLETLRKRTLEPEQTDKILVNAIKDTSRLTNLIETILLSAQLDSHNYQLTLSEQNISNIVSEYIDSFNLHTNTQHNIIKQIEPNVRVLADKMGIEAILGNLLSNAVKYAPPESDIIVQIQQKDIECILQVCDHGKGIPTDKRKRIFEKFIRLEDENTRQHKGTGLGLYIVQQIVQQHKAKIQIKDNQPSGSIFEISFKNFDKV